MWPSFLFPRFARTASRNHPLHHSCGSSGSLRRYRPTLEVLEDRSVPGTLRVTSALDDGSSGTLRAVIAGAHSGDTIRFAPGLKNETIKLSQGELAITTNLTIIGLGADELAVSGTGSFRVFDIASGVSATIAGLTITRGHADMGGGIENEGGNLTLFGDIVSDNTAILMGGGGVCNMGTLTVNSSVVSCNSALMGGGICNMGTLSVSHSAFIGNTAVTGSMTMDMGGMMGMGGGICNMGTLTVSSSAFIGNNAAVNGGGISNQSGAVLTLFQSVLVGDTAPQGADLYSASGGTVIVIDSLT
jgi:hypothetical protein